MLGVDLGTHRIGLAVSDPSGTVAQPLKVLARAGHRSQDHEAVVATARELEAEAIVVGLPLSLGGEVGTAARKVLSEVDALRRLAAPAGISVETQDERLSTVTAEAAMVEAGERRRKRRESVDQVAAAVFLQAWLDGRRS